MEPSSSRDSLAKRASGGLIRFQVFLALLLFVPAGTVRYWQAWVYWLLFSACLTLISLLDEERYLAQELPGYDGYRRQVPCRLIPHVW